LLRRNAEMIGNGTLLTMTGSPAESSFESCLTTLGEVHDESVYGAIERLIGAAEPVGFTVPDLIRMLNEGMSLESLFKVIEVRMTGTCVN
jgi:hypothetical protein